MFLDVLRQHGLCDGSLALAAWHFLAVLEHNQGGQPIHLQRKGQGNVCSIKQGTLQTRPAQQRLLLTGLSHAFMWLLVTGRTCCHNGMCRFVLLYA